ncbi:cobalt ECF transporter T component CbiQ [Thalassobius sp. I31.1]|uniref:cobalt ECF transporter T component CbiQ n=1 Tax=Thalassobius sp. I31.1 TaxID=2109912 RepID=UPI000D1B5417|nr:cobalt ECF transporter T component CbiQ [Thalassobius sp. I31.1]
MTYVLSTSIEPPAVPALRRLDPRLRIMSAVAFAITAVALQSLPLLTVMLLVAVMLMIAAKLPVGQTLKRVIAMDSFIIVMIAFLPFTMEGTPIFTLFGFPASYEGLIRAIEIALTANAVVMAMLALAGSMEEVTFGQALHRLKVPAKLVHLLLFTIRYIEVLRQEYRRLRQAMKCRGFRPGTNGHTYRSFGYLVGMMLIRAMERSERIMDAMKCRGFAGTLPMTQRFELRGFDVVFALGFSLFMTAMLMKEYLL